MNLQSKFVLIFFFLFLEVSYSQVALIGYSESSESITLNLKLSPVHLFQVDLKNNKILRTGYFDEGNPQAPALPSKTIVVGLPPESKPKLSYTIKSQQKITNSLSLNPSVKLMNDSTLSYDFSGDIPNLSYDKEKVKIFGFLNIDGIFCAVIVINQYYYEPANNLVNQIDEIEIKLSFETKLFSYDSNVQSSDTYFSEKISHPEILNYSYAKKYKLKKTAAKESDPTGEWINYDRTYLKIGVTANGVYRINYGDFISAGVDPQSINPQQFSLLRKGERIPFYISSGSNTFFGLTDFIEFVGERSMGENYRMISKSGEPYKEYLDRYTDTTIYWLTWGGDKGTLITGTNNTASRTNADTLNFYYETIHNEKNIVFDFSYPDLVKREMPFWVENKTWHEGLLGVGQKNINVTITDVLPGMPFYIYAKLQDYASDIETGSHLLSIGINNANKSNTVTVNKYAQAVLSNELNSSILQNGTNTINVYSLPTAAQINTCIFDWSEIEYPRYIKLISDSLTIPFEHVANAGTHNIKIGNLRSTKYVIWNYGKYCKRYYLQAENTNLIFADTIDSTTKILIASEDKILHPTIFYAKEFVNLRLDQNQADYILITDKNFSAAATEYLKFINDFYKIKTKLVFTNDIYDEYSYGFFNPEAIRSFLKSTHANWLEPYPAYVFLVGSANYDYHRNKAVYLKIPEPISYVPSYGAPVSDSWFVIWDSTSAYIPQMSIGRIPVSTQEEFYWYTEKHKELARGRFDSWNKRFLFFSGGTGNSQASIDQLKSLNDQIINDYVKPAPIGGSYTHFYKTINPTSNFGPYSSEQIQSAIDSGAVFISYLGHSGTQTWDNSITDPSQLMNKINRYPLITDFGCSTARFAEPDVTSFSQLFVDRPSGQAIAYIGNSSLGFTSTSYSFPKIFYKKMLIDSIRTIGNIHRLAKMELLQTYGIGNAYQLFSLTNTLIGDPLINIPIPSKVNLSVGNKDIAVLTGNLNDTIDSTKIKVGFHNFGLVLNDSLTTTVRDSYNGIQNYTFQIERPIPLNSDSIIVTLPTKNKPGLHELNIRLGTNENVDEIYKDDNEATFNLIVPSGAIKNFCVYDIQGISPNPVKVLNPSNNPGSDKFITEISSSGDFQNKSEIETKFDTLATNVYIPATYLNKRIWMRTKIFSGSAFNNSISFFIKENGKYYLGDSLSLSSMRLNRLRVNGEKIMLDSNRVILKALSAGFNDGNTALIQINGQNFIPENTLRGHNVVLLDENTYEFVRYFRFDLYGDANAANEYSSLLDTLSQKYLVLFAVSDEGAVSSSSLRNKIKMFGSKLIDKVGFRSSWAMIGKKGAVQGSVTEAYAPMFGGRVQVDTMITTRYSEGNFITGKIGPSAGWKTLRINDNQTSDAAITYKLIGIRSNENIDTLNFAFTESNILDLTAIDANKYPYIRLEGIFSALPKTISPSLNNVEVNYNNPAELALNYQTVTIGDDTIAQGESADLSFYVYNAGESRADSFKVRVEVVKPDNSREKIFEQIVDSLGVEKRKSFNVSYNTASSIGNRSFYITIDPDSKILELYKDNNLYSVPFYVKANTAPASIKLTFDGNDIINGDYVSTNPNIRIELNDMSQIPVSDTSHVQLYLNNKRISLSSKDINYSFSDNNPKFVVNYKPTLSDGTHSLKVLGTNATGQVIDSAGVVKKFMVSNQAQLLYVYNYPNPFSSETFFTFKLTQIPDELKIRIFAVSGRMIKELIAPSSTLNYDFNRIVWDGRDEDGDLAANGVYFYKVIMKKGTETIQATQKLAIVR